MNARLQSLRESFRHGLATLGSLMLKQAELGFIALFASIGLTLAGLENTSVEPAIFTLAAAAGGGILLGFSARGLLRSHSLLLQWASALVAMILMLFLIGWFTSGFVGISPAVMPRRQPDWGALAQMLAGSFSCALSLKARRWWIRNNAFANAVVDGTDAARRSNVRLVSNKADAPPEVRPGLLERMRNGLRGWRRRAKKDEVRLVGVEEHRCPYCLQLIADRDPRGVVICPVCHTRHHKDCWAITGMCQVPHYHA
jgi:ribosomal protein L37AE/L43A